MMKYFAIAALAACCLTIPAEAHRRHKNNYHHHHYDPEYTIICDVAGCSWRLKQPKLRVSKNCVYKPWTNKTVCKFK